MNSSEIKLQLFRQIDILPENIVVELKDVVQSFLQQRYSKIQLTDVDVNGAEIQTLIAHNQAFDFLNADEEDIYSDADLIEKY
jgi:hypothetical protein